MIHKLHPILHRFMAPAGDDSGTGGGAVDRGDDWTPTDDDAPDTKDDEGTKDDGEDGEKGSKAGLRDGEDTDEDPDDDAAEGKDADKRKRKDNRIPLARHKELLQKERERRETLERELAKEREGKQLAKSNEDLTKAESAIEAMEKEYLGLLEKGDADAAAAKMREIRKAERQVVAQRVEFEAKAAEARAYERVRYDTTLERLEAAYPVINPDHEDYSEEKLAEVAELMQGYLATRKYTRAEALQKAAKVLLGTATKKQEAATEVDVRVDKDEVAKELAKERKAAQVKKNLETAGKQPPSTATVGQDSDKAGGKLKAADVIKMSQAEFAKLSEKELAGLRGDDY